MKKTKIIWLDSDALELGSLIEKKAVAYGYHAALGGSAFYRGYSENDADFIIYPHSGAKQDTDGFLKSMAMIMTDMESCSTLGYSSTGKEIYSCKYIGKAVNLIILTLSWE